MVEMIRQMLAEWNAATDAQRAEALELARKAADDAERRMLARAKAVR